MSRLTYKVGDWVEVRSLEEILPTLDADGALGGTPFMPEMVQFCGQRFPVHKSAHKGCDTVFPVRSRWFDDAVHLRTRCDGQAHDGCQAGCLLYWKTAWLKRVDGPAHDLAKGASAPIAPPRGIAASQELRVDLSRLRQNTIVRFEENVPVYRCQATQLPYASRNLEWW